MQPARVVDIAPMTMVQRMHKSQAELDLIRHGAGVADVGGFAIRDAIDVGAREIDVAMAGRNSMELEIAKRFPDAEYRDSWVWFQSGINTDGAHNPVTARQLRRGDILSLNTFPMISGYYIALERTLFVGEVDPASLRIWEANVAAHEYGMSLLKPGVSCADVTHKINAFLEERSLRSASCCSTARLGTAIHLVCCRITMAARRAWSCAKTSTQCWSPAW